MNVDFSGGARGGAEKTGLLGNGQPVHRAPRPVPAKNRGPARVLKAHNFSEGS